MKILMATMGLDIGGAETHIVELSKELTRQGHEILVASNGGAYVPELTDAGIRHFKVPMNRRSIGPMLKSLQALRRIIRTEHPDIVHAHARIPGFLCGLLKQTMKFPFVTTAHWVFDTGGMLRFLTNWGEKTIAVSEDIRRYLIESYGLEEQNIFVTINGIDTEKFSPTVSGESVRREYNISPEAPVIVHVSRLDESRALAARYLIETAPELSERVPGAVVLITGGGNVYKGLQELASEANRRAKRECVVLTGPRTDINAVAAAGDVFVGVSRAALEGMSAGLPTVIAGNEGYMGLFTEEKLEPGIEGNFCCRGFPQTERQRLQEDVAACLLMPKEERVRLGELGRRVVKEHYSVRRMAQDALTAYHAAQRPRRIVMSGYYGFGNTGDEAILESVLGLIRETQPDSEVTVLSRSPKATASTYNCKAIQRFSPFRVAQAVRKCDILVSGGGSLLQDATSSRSIWYYLTIIRTAERRRKRVVLLANGIGPVLRDRNRKRVKEAVEGADVVTLRDEDSLKTLREMGVKRSDITVTADPVFLLPPPDEERTDELLARAGVKGDFIAVSVRPLEEGDFRVSVARVCDELNKRFGVTTVFVPFQPTRDIPVSRAVAEQMKTPSTILPAGCTARELMGVMTRSVLVLSMRLHAVIFAACAGTPTVGFSYDPKVAACLRMLDQPSAGSAEHIDEAGAVESASRILSDRKTAVSNLRKRREQISALAEKNREIFQKLV